MIINALIEWVWSVSTAVGAVFLFFLARRAYHEYQAACNSKNQRMILVSRINVRSAFAWFLAFTFFSFAGFVALIRPDVAARKPVELIIPLLLVVSVVIVSYSVLLNFRDSNKLYSLIRKVIQEMRILQEKNGEGSK